MNQKIKLTNSFDIKRRISKLHYAAVLNSANNIMERITRGVRRATPEQVHAPNKYVKAYSIPFWNAANGKPHCGVFLFILSV